VQVILNILKKLGSIKFTHVLPRLLARGLDEPSC